MKGLLTIIFIALMLPLTAQTEKEKLAAIEQARQDEKQRLIKQTLDSAMTLTDMGEYEAADVKYQTVLKNIRSVPSDLTYYFGLNSFHLGLNRQSIDWLNKYIQLKGTTGKYSSEAVTVLKKAEAALITVKKEDAKQATEILSRNFDIDCGPTGKVVCPVCNGSTVVIKRNYLGDTYKTCTYCHKLGYLTCEEYNKLLRGQLQAQGN